MGSNLPKGWQRKKIVKVAKVTSGKRPPKVNEHISLECSIPIYGGAGKMGYTMEPLYKEPTLVTGRVGTLGLIHKASKLSWPSDNTLVLIPNASEIDYVFLYYSLKLKMLDLLSLNRGTSNPLVTQGDVDQLEIICPPLAEQRRIASILGALDDKIELNHEMNKTLEEMAQAIFKHWFVDFEFPDENGKPYKSSGGEMVYSEELQKEIPKGWGVKPIDEIADFLNGLALQKYPPKNENYLPVIKIRELRQGVTESSDRASPNIDKRYIVDNGDVLFSWSGSLEVCIWCGGKGALNQHLFKVTSQTYPKWFYYQWIKFYLPKFRHIAKGKATTMGHIRRHHLSETYVIVPFHEVMEKMNETINPLIETTINNSIESRQLAMLRDTLLPKLLSGEIRVYVEKDTEVSS